MSLSNLPDIEFIEVDPEKIIAETITSYQNAYFESTGQAITLAPGDPIRIFLYTQALREILLRQQINHAAKMNLLKYSSGNFLDHIGARNRVPRKQAQPAIDVLQLNFSQAQTSVTSIPKGTRFSPGNNIYFSIDEDYELAAGAQQIEVNVTCEQAGEVGNGYLPGQINVIVDPIPFLISATNLYGSQGGTEIEDDESYREHIYNAPEGFSVAGPDDAYKYLTKSYNSSIIDVFIDNPSDGVVDIRVLLENGELPTQAFLDGLVAYFDKSKRPLTDRVQASAPNLVDYTIDATYYLYNSDDMNVAERQARVNAAFNDYILWQKSKIGRDINPSELNYRLREAGAKRVVIASPTYLAINQTDIANLSSSLLQYGGAEDD